MVRAVNATALAVAAKVANDSQIRTSSAVVNKKMLGRQILAARDLIGMSQAELATAAGVSVNTLMSWETGQRVPRRETVRLVCEALERRGIEFLNHGSPGVRIRADKAMIPS